MIQRVDIFRRMPTGGTAYGKNNEEDQLNPFFQTTDQIKSEKDLVAPSDDDLPGMLERADFVGGDPDERSYSQRKEDRDRMARTQLAEENMKAHREIDRLSQFIINEFPDFLKGGSAVDIAIDIMSSLKEAKHS